MLALAVQPQRTAVAPVPVPIPQSQQIIFPGQSTTLTWQTPEGYIPHATNDWITLIKVGTQIGPVEGYGTWKWNRPASTHGQTTVIAPDKPGYYEWRYYSVNYDLIIRSQPVLLAQPGSNPETSDSTPVLLSEFFPVMGKPTLLTQEQRLANTNKLQLALDKAQSESRNVLLPTGDLSIEFSQARPNLRIWSDLLVKSETRTNIHIGPDFPAFYMNVWKAEPTKSYVFEISDNVFPIASRIDIDGLVAEIIQYTSNYFLSEGSGQDNINRTYIFKNQRITDDIKTKRGFSDVFMIMPDKLITINTETKFKLESSIVRSLGQVVVFYAKNGTVDVVNCDLETGWIYGNGNGYGNCIYTHQNLNINIRNNTITTRFGRNCIANRGQRAEGRSKYAVVSGNIFKSNRVAAKKEIGMPVSSSDEVYGVGIGWDKFIAGNITDNYFDASLNIALQYWGQFNMNGGTIESRLAFGGAGDLTGEKPIISVNGTRFNNIMAIIQSALENAIWKFDGINVDSNIVTTLFATYVRPQKVYVNNSFFRINANAILSETYPGGIFVQTNNVEVRQ